MIDANDNRNVHQIILFSMSKWFVFAFFSYSLYTLRALARNAKRKILVSAQFAGRRKSLDVCRRRCVNLLYANYCKWAHANVIKIQLNNRTTLNIIFNLRWCIPTIDMQIPGVIVGIDEKREKSNRFRVLLFDSDYRSGDIVSLVFIFGLIHLIKKQFTVHNLTCRLRFCTQAIRTYSYKHALSCRCMEQRKHKTTPMKLMKFISACHDIRTHGKCCFVFGCRECKSKQPNLFNDSVICVTR